MNVSLVDRIKIIFNHGAFTLGILFLVVGGIFTYVVVLNSNFEDYKYWVMPSEKSIGFIDYVQYTNWEINEESYYEYGFSFSDPETKETFRNASYGYYWNVIPGDSVNVEYLVSDPYIARIDGMESGILGFWAFFFVSIFPIVGFFVCRPGFIGTFKKVGILKNGVLTEGQLARREYANASVNDQAVMHFYFVYRVGQREYETKVTTHRGDELTDDKFEEIVYNKKHPERALVVDDLPESIREKIWKQLG